ncbi:MAG: hypothetical protein KJ749_06675, partial [Planctomycetes bacterium]|nr:hypothetical protein [Planctomycetota bacterium]
MSGALAELATLRWLTPDKSCRVLAEAAAAGAPVCLYADDECTDEVWSASIVAVDREHLLLAEGAGNAPALPRNMPSTLRAEIVLDGARYRFNVKCPNTVTDVEPGSLRTACPDRIAVVNRRRCRRRRLRPAAVVTIRAADAPEVIRCRAAMMNVSVDGLACRIS